MRVILTDMLEYLANASTRDLAELLLMALAGQAVLWGLLLAMAWLITNGAWLLAVVLLCLVLLCEKS